MMFPKPSNVVSRPNSIGEKVLAYIKQYLMSRDVKLQIEAVQVLIHYLKIDTASLGQDPTLVPDRLLDADIAEFLGEAMATQNHVLLTNIFVCLELLSTSEKFFAQNHTVCHVLECLLRTIHFMLLKSEESLILSEALQLLATIFGGYDRNLPLSSVCNMRQVLELVGSILSRGQSDSRTVLSAGLVLYTLLLHSHPQDLSMFMQLPGIVKHCFVALTRLVPNQEMVNKAVPLMARIGYAAIRSCHKVNYDNMDVDLDEWRAPESQHSTSICKEEILQSVVECVQLVCAPYIVDLAIDMSNSDTCHSVLICVNALYQDTGIDYEQLSHELALLGYIIFLPLTSTWAEKRQLKSLKIVSMSVLGEFLASLSQNALGVVVSWPGGFPTYKAHLMKATHDIPTDNELWLQILLIRGAPQFYKDFIIVYFYFFFLFLPSPLDYKLDLSVLTVYLLEFSSPSQYPAPIFKALWFIFAISTLSGQGSVSKLQVDNATMVLLNSFEKGTELSEVYTHHPAILFWAFSTPKIHANLQFGIMSKWLEKESDSSNVQLMHLVLANQNASFCLLDVIQYGESKTVEHAVNLLSKAIVYEGKKGAEDLILMLWDTLPLVLAQYSSRPDSLQASNVTCFIKVACTSIPSTPSVTTILRTASLLTSLLARRSHTHPELSVVATQLAMYLLIMAEHLKDERVLTSYITYENFLEALREGVQRPYSAITLPSLKLLTHIVQFQQNYETQSRRQFQRSCSMSIDAEDLLALLAPKNISVLTVSLHLVCLLLQSRLPAPAIRITTHDSESISTQFVRSLFFKLQNLCSMKLPGITNSCWKCMGVVLQYASECHPDSSLLPLLATQPWTHLMIRFAVPSKSAELSDEFLYFLCWWLLFYDAKNNMVQSGNVRMSRRKSRAPYPDLLSTSVTRLGPALLTIADSDNASTQQTQLALLVISRILVSVAELQSEMEMALKKKLLEFNHNPASTAIQ